MRLVDIAVNLTDVQFSGFYASKRVHSADHCSVLQRAYRSGVHKIIVTGTSVQDSKDAVELCNTLQPSTEVELFCTAGIHPTNAAEKAIGWQRELMQLANANPRAIVAFGEMGIDKLRLQHCPLSVQMQTFIEQLEMVKVQDERKLPLFVHCREAFEEVCECFGKVWPNGEQLERLVVIHSFDGNELELRGFLERGFYISLNGCSFKKTGALQVMQKVPVERLLLETDAPWCQITSTSQAFALKEAECALPVHAVVKKEKHSPEAMVKGRNEPANLVHLVQVMSKVLEISPVELAEAVWSNVHRIFWPAESGRV